MCIRQVFIQGGFTWAVNLNQSVFSCMAQLKRSVTDPLRTMTDRAMPAPSAPRGTYPPPIAVRFRRCASWRAAAPSSLARSRRISTMGSCRPRLLVVRRNRAAIMSQRRACTARSGSLTRAWHGAGPEPWAPVAHGRQGHQRTGALPGKSSDREAVQQSQFSTSSIRTQGTCCDRGSTQRHPCIVRAAWTASHVSAWQSTGSTRIGRSC